MSDEVRKIDLNLPVDAHINQTAAIHASLTSTMDRARAELSNGGPSGLVVAADFQTAGRGRYDRRWESPRKGDLLMSIGLRPTATAVGLLSVAAGLAVLQAVESMANVETTIKWPNDVRIRGLKVGGVLVESRVEGSDIEAVVGIGLNLVLDPTEHPDIADTATSLLAETGQTIPRDLALRAVAARFDHVYRNLLANWTPVDDWVCKLDTIGSEVTVEFSNGESSISGKAVSVSETGELIVERPDGGRIACNAGEVTLQAASRAVRRAGK